MKKTISALVIAAMPLLIAEQAWARTSSFSRFATGAVVGAGAAYLLTRPSNSEAANTSSQEALNRAVIACKNAQGNYDFNRNICVTR